MKSTPIPSNKPFCFFVKWLVTAILSVCLVVVFGLQFSVAQELVGIPGITEPVQDVILSLPTTGTVARIFFKEGDYVKKGEIILNHNIQLETLEVERRELIWKSTAELKSAITRVATLGSLLEASRELYEATGSISMEELEQQQLEYDLSVAEKERLENNEKRENIEYLIAVELLNKRRLRAPFAGIITEVLVNIGETSELNDPLLHLVDTSRGVFVCTVEEQVGRTLKRGPSVDLVLDAGASTIKLKGKIIYVDPVVDPASGLQKVKVVFQNGDGKIYPGVAGMMYLTGGK